MVTPADSDACDSDPVLLTRKLRSEEKVTRQNPFSPHLFSI